MKRVYRYWCIEQPPVPGNVPPGFIRMDAADEDGEMTDEEGHIITAWGMVEYERPLTEAEQDKYGLEEYR